jgi:predicted DCC family thiol-disulfide oxidoreductase YuxK
MNGVAVFLYDGDCAFCSRCAEVLRHRLRSPVPIVAWQRTDLAPLGVTAAECAESVRYVHAGRVSAGPVAIADLLRTATRRRDVGWRIAGRLLGTRPVLLLAWPVYRWVARNRHRLPGGTEVCEMRNVARSRPGGQQATGNAAR